MLPLHHAKLQNSVFDSENRQDKDLCLFAFPRLFSITANTGHREVKIKTPTQLGGNRPK